MSAAPDQAGLLRALDPEARTRALSPTVDRLAGALCAGLCLYAFYWTQFPVTTQAYRASFLALALVATFLVYPVGGRRGAILAVAVALLPVLGAVAYVVTEMPAGLSAAFGGLEPTAQWALAATGVLIAFLGAGLGVPWLSRRGIGGVPLVDWVLQVLAVLSLGWLTLHFAEALHRITSPSVLEVAFGLIAIVLCGEAARRTGGWALPATALALLLYAYFGAYAPEPFDHRGYSITRIVGQNFLTLEGMFGVPLDVAATFIVLFTVYGAVLEASGAGRFFLDFAFALTGRSSRGGPVGVGRAVTLAGFLFGTVSGSGVATTVTLGSLSWPLLRRAGYDKDDAGGLLASAGLGAILSPPTLGAAAFLIAEYLKISYLDVLLMALIPTVLYYSSCYLMIAAAAARAKPTEESRGSEDGSGPTGPSAFELLKRGGYHFSSLVVVAGLMAAGLSVFMAVYWATLLAVALSYWHPETRLTSRRSGVIGLAAAVVFFLATRTAPAEAAWLAWTGSEPTLAVAAAVGLGALVLAALGGVRWSTVPSSVGSSSEDSRLLEALSAGGRGALGVTATTAIAGVLVSVVTLTGLGLKLSGIIVSLAGGVPLAIVLMSGLSVMILGLAVPVTASYIIAAVMVVPALTQAGLSEAAAHMFVFYYAVLSDVSPPTALSPLAASAITGGDPLRTTLASWRFCLPAFVVPLLFLKEHGDGLLGLGGAGSVVEAFVVAAVVVLALAVATSGRLGSASVGAGARVAALGGAAGAAFLPTGWALAAAFAALAAPAGYRRWRGLGKSF